MEEEKVNLKDVLYYARALPDVGVYDVCELKVRAVYDTWFSAIDKDTKRAYLFNYSDIGKVVFRDRLSALNVVIDAEIDHGRRFFEKNNDIYE